MGWISMFRSSYRLCIDLVILTVRTDKTDINHPLRIVDPTHQAIFIAGDIESRPAVQEYARTADVPLQIGRCRPIGLTDQAIPRHQWLPRVRIGRVSGEESLEG